MKKLIIVLLALVAIILLTGCDSGEVVGPELDPSPINEIVIKEITIEEIQITPIVIE